jgi:uncharacterized damage-inducible protein DinB
MYAPFQDRFEALENQRKALFSILEKEPQELLEKQPPQGGWSVAQVLGHLVEAETASLKYLRTKLKYADTVGPSSFADRFRAGLLRTWLALPLKAKAPAALAEPAPDLSITAIMADYTALREQWKQELENIPAHLNKGQLFKHGIAGKMDLTEALVFFRGHFKHHEKQIDRILTSVKAG